MLREDTFGFLVEPYGEEVVDVSYWVSVDGTQGLWDAGWRPYLMPRVSRFLVCRLYSDGHLRLWVWPPPLSLIPLLSGSDSAIPPVH